ncbi:recombinase family protein [Streptomyces sp. NPDC056485]|uniref:recombinase family protein n=1 Tax=Streptomyces sp. NPDC056485 TaxID=3345834 RepID=UPI0036A9744A
MERKATELMTLSADLQAGGILLELLTGIYDPNGMGAMFFAVLAIAGQVERNYIREKTLKGQVTVAAKSNHGGCRKVADDDMLTFDGAQEVSRPHTRGWDRPTHPNSLPPWMLTCGRVPQWRDRPILEVIR